MGAIFFTISFICLVGAVYFLFHLLHAGVYPSKYILQRKLVACSAGGLLFMIIGFVLR